MNESDRVRLCDVRFGATPKPARNVRRARGLPKSAKASTQMRYGWGLRAMVSPQAKAANGLGWAFQLSRETRQPSNCS